MVEEKLTEGVLTPIEHHARIQATPDDSFTSTQSTIEGRMHAATQHLRQVASRIVDAALERVPLRAAIVVGSAARGDADFYSDLDLMLYVDELPPEHIPADIRVAVGGTNPISKGEPTEHFCGEEFEVDGVRAEVSFMTVARVEWRLDQLLERLEEIDSPVQKVLAGMLEGLPLYGEELVERWQARMRDYPEPLRRAMVERHWSFFPLWYHGEAIAARDAELWRLDMLLEAAFNLLAVLAGLNRLYFRRAELKRMRSLTGKMELAPPNLADRLESLFRLEPEPAAAELGRLVEETRALVARDFPDLELPLQFSPGQRQKPWR
jgi:predicted nucleotidyltransferase